MSSKFNPIAYNPVYTRDAATLAILFLAWKVFGLTIKESAAIAGTFLGGTSPFVRQLVRPVAKDSTLLPLLEKPEAPTAPPNNTVNTGWSPKVKPARDSTPERPDPTRTT